MANIQNNNLWPLTFKRFPQLFQSKSICIKHTTCKTCRNHRLNNIESNLQKNFNWNSSGSLLGGIGAAILNNYYNKTWTMLTPKEKSGKYANSFNVCSGSIEDEDNGCFIDAAIREIKEELRIYLNYKTFDKMFRGSNGSIRLHFVNSTPIIMGIIVGISRTNNLNYCIQQLSLGKNVVYDVEQNANIVLNSKITNSDCEISEIDFVVIGKDLNPENIKLELSQYATDVMNVVIKSFNP